MIRRTATGICIIATLETLRVFEDALRSHSLLAPYSVVRHRFDAAQLTNGKNDTTGFNLSKGILCIIAAGEGVSCFLFFRTSFRICHALIGNFQRSRAFRRHAPFFNVSGLLACVLCASRKLYDGMALHCLRALFTALQCSLVTTKLESLYY